MNQINSAAAQLRKSKLVAKSIHISHIHLLNCAQMPTYPFNIFKSMIHDCARRFVKNKVPFLIGIVKFDKLFKMQFQPVLLEKWIIPRDRVFPKI